MHVTKQINYCQPASTQPAHVAWVNLAFADQQPAEDDHRHIVQTQLDTDVEPAYSVKPTMTLPATYLTRYRLMAN